MNEPLSSYSNKFVLLNAPASLFRPGKPAKSQKKGSLASQIASISEEQSSQRTLSSLIWPLATKNNRMALSLVSLMAKGRWKSER